MVVTCLIMIKVIEVIVVKQIIAKMEKIYKSMIFNIGVT